MPKIIGFGLESVVSYEEAHIEVTPGITYVRGLNYDADPANPTSNGAGKSVLFSVIPNIRYSAVPTATKQRRQRKAILRNKKSMAYMIYQQADGGPEYEIVQRAGGYSIFENSEDTQIKGIPGAEKFIAEKFPMSELAFYTYTFVSTLRPHQFRPATDADRLTRFVELNKLDQYEKLQTYFSTMAAAIKTAEVEASTLGRQRLEVLESLKSVDDSVTEDVYSDAKANVDSIDAEVKSLETEKYEALKFDNSLGALERVEHDLDKLRAKYPYKKSPDKMYDELKGLRRLAQEWSEYEVAFAQYTKNVSRVKSDLKAVERPKKEAQYYKDKKSAAIKALEKIEDKLDRCQEKQQKYEQVLETIDALKARLKDLPDVGASDNFESEIADCITALGLKKLLDHDHDDDSRCPTCLSPVDLDNVRKTVKSAEKRLPELRQKQKAVEVSKDLKVAKVNLSSLTDLSKTIADLKTQQKQEEQVQKEAEFALGILDKIKDLERQMARFEKPDQPDQPKPDLDLRTLEKHIDLCAEIQKQLKAKTTILSASKEVNMTRIFGPQAVAEERRKLAERIKDLDRKIKKVSETKSRYVSCIEKYKQAKHSKALFGKQLTSIDSKLAALEPEIKRKRIVDALVKAYGKKGLRSFAANERAKLLEDNLNHYRDLIFFEPFIFKVVASETGLSILVDRNNGKDSAVSDVRELSGAESNCFDLLFTMSQLALTPAQERLNILILDEPTSHMCEVSRELFNTRFLPAIKEMVSSIFVITPHKDDTMPDAREWLIEKRNGVSCLKT